MIRKVALKKRPPIKRLMELFDVDGERFTFPWNQLPCTNDENSKRIRNICSQILGISERKIKNCVLHIITDDIPTHADEMSAGVYILPLKFSKTVEFYDETRVVNFEKGYAYKFNDWVRHGISNPRFAKIILVTIDT